MSRSTAWQVGIVAIAAVVAVLLDMLLFLGPRERMPAHRPADVAAVARELGREVVRRSLPPAPFPDRRLRAGPGEPSSAAK